MAALLFVVSVLVVCSLLLAGGLQQAEAVVKAVHDLQLNLELGVDEFPDGLLRAGSRTAPRRGKICAQPALLFLVPGTLIPTFAIALQDGTLKDLWAASYGPSVPTEGSDQPADAEAADKRD
ncbi:unnamed protein product [Prorocentrum cordatum]|uniref:Uncharacterized protein n=1 Tax=Prorocentrum cordatum TaxID=2364126 RepID=A0ABN9QVV0_9DINO|nr:unnamed protein product [Polarella glacialis]